MIDGLILLGLLAFLVAFFVASVRRRLGLKVTGGVYAITMALFAIAALALWATNRR